MSLILLGYRGSGKTSVGRKVAARLGWKFVDVDEVIVQRAGKSIKEIFASEREQGFRDVESGVLRDVVGLEQHVIALGGGSVLREENRKLLMALKHPRVYLRCEAEVLYAHIQGDATTGAMRPALTQLGGGIEEVRHLLALREPLYREVATNEIDVTKLEIDEVVERILTMM